MCVCVHGSPARLPLLDIALDQGEVGHTDMAVEVPGWWSYTSPAAVEKPRSKLTVSEFYPTGHTNGGGTIKMRIDRKRAMEAWPFPTFRGDRSFEELVHDLAVGTLQPTRRTAATSSRRSSSLSTCTRASTTRWRGS